MSLLSQTFLTYLSSEILVTEIERARFKLTQAKALKIDLITRFINDDSGKYSQVKSLTSKRIFFLGKNKRLNKRNIDGTVIIISSASILLTNLINLATCLISCNALLTNALGFSVLSGLHT